MAKTNESPKPSTGGDKGNVTKPVKPRIKLPRFYLSIGLLVLLFLFPFTASASKLSVLYLWADDGKKSGRTSGNVQMRNGRARGMAFFATVLNQYTSAAKSVFAFFNSNWRNLSEPQRLSWLGYMTFVSDRFAKEVKVTGKTAYSQLNINIANVDGTAILLPPIVSAPRYTALNSVTADASAGTVSIDYVMNAEGGTTLIWATKPLSAGVSKPSKSAFRLVSVGDTSAASPLAFGADYVARFGAITSKAGEKIFIRFVVVDAASGLTSIASETQTIIVA
ncbi:MAG TPA: hypothetical protein VK590_01290 [Saprospiraceae bacterium]|nr:hypothetical protein [Saprospiraceae bacterium]